MKTGRTVVITGAAGGMGAELTRRFIDNGDVVIATDTSAEALERLAATVASDRVHISKADISDEADTVALARLAADNTGRVDVLLNVAGFFPVQNFLEMTADDWRRVIDINLTGAALMCKAMLPLMIGRGWGRIVNIGSASVFEGQAHYVAAKSGLIELSRSLAREFGREGITVNIIAPGVTVTATAKKTLPETVQATAIKTRCIQREELASDLTGTVFFLASPDADFITGQTVIVDGGNQMI